MLRRMILPAACLASTLGYNINHPRSTFKIKCDNDAKVAPSTQTILPEKHDFELDPKIWKRIDVELLSKDFQHFKKDHVLHETLSGNDMVEKYEVYINSAGDDIKEIKCLIRLGHKLNGYPKTVHGGKILCLVECYYIRLCDTYHKTGLIDFVWIWIGITSLLFDNSFGWLMFSNKLPSSVTASLKVDFRYTLSLHSVGFPLPFRKRVISLT